MAHLSVKIANAIESGDFNALQRRLNRSQKSDLVYMKTHIVDMVARSIEPAKRKADEVFMAVLKTTLYHGITSSDFTLVQRLHKEYDGCFSKNTETHGTTVGKLALEVRSRIAAAGMESLKTLEQKALSIVSLFA